MKSLDRYIAATVWNAICLVLLVVLALDFAGDLIDQAADLRNRYNIGQALIYATLKIPGSAVDYLGFAVLIGCLVGMGALSARNELTVIRAAGISKLRLFWMVFKPVLVLIALGMLVAEYLSPNLEQVAESRKDLLRGDQAQVEQTGLWLRDREDFIHANAVYPGGILFGLARYRVENDLLKSVSFAERATFQAEGEYWLEENVVETLIDEDGVQIESDESRRWNTELTPALLGMASLDPDQLSMVNLETYAGYLGDDNPQVGRYEVEFWSKVLQPLSIAALLLVGLSFVYGSNRQQPLGQRIFIGVFIAIVFQVSHDILGPASVIWGFPAWLAVGSPIVLTALAGLVLSARHV